MLGTGQGTVATRKHCLILQVRQWRATGVSHLLKLTHPYMVKRGLYQGSLILKLIFFPFGYCGETWEVCAYVCIQCEAKCGNEKGCGSLVCPWSELPQRLEEVQIKE